MSPYLLYLQGQNEIFNPLLVIEYVVYINTMKMGLLSEYFKSSEILLTRNLKIKVDQGFP